MRNTELIYKYNYITGDILATYGSIKEAAICNNTTYAKIYKMLQQDRLSYPRDDFYFGYEPKSRWVIRVYDNETLELLGTYKNIKDAAVATGVSAQQIQWQIAKDLPITQERIKGSTTLFFHREEIEEDDD